MLCRSLELQADLLAVAAHLCYIHTEADRPDALPAGSTSAGLALDPAAAPLNHDALAAFGGAQAFLQCMLDCPSEHARGCALSVVLDAASTQALAREPALDSLLQSRTSTRSVCVAS